MRRILLPLLAVTFLNACSGDQQPVGPTSPESSVLASQASGATTTVTERTISINRMPYAACLGERLAVTGTRHIRTRTTIDANGGMHVQMLINDRGWTAVGQTSGKIWTLVAGMAPVSLNASGSTPQTSFTWAGGQVFRPSDPSMPVLLFNGPWHYTVNAQGEVTTDFDKYEFFICRGN